MLYTYTCHLSLRIRLPPPPHPPHRPPLVGTQASLAVARRHRGRFNVAPSTRARREEGTYPPAGSPFAPSPLPAVGYLPPRPPLPLGRPRRSTGAPRQGGRLISQRQLGRPPPTEWPGWPPCPTMRDERASGVGGGDWRAKGGPTITPAGRRCSPSFTASVRQSYFWARGRPPPCHLGPTPSLLASLLTPGGGGGGVVPLATAVKYLLVLFHPAGFGPPPPDPPPHQPPLVGERLRGSQPVPVCSQSSWVEKMLAPQQPRLPGCRPVHPPPAGSDLPTSRERPPAGVLRETSWPLPRTLLWCLWVGRMGGSFYEKGGPRAGVGGGVPSPERGGPESRAGAVRVLWARVLQRSAWRGGSPL